MNMLGQPWLCFQKPLILLGDQHFKSTFEGSISGRSLFTPAAFVL